MRIHLLFLGLLCAALASGFGCKKSAAAAPEPAPAVMRGVKVDLPKLQQKLEQSNPDVQQAMSRMLMALRSRNFEMAIMELDKVANNPSTTEEQKKLALKVIDQLKEVMNKPPGSQ